MPVPSFSLEYNPPPTVGSFMASDAFVRVVIGPVGSGKSSGCIVEIIRRAIQQAATPADGIRRTRFAVIRNTYRELKDTTRRTFEQWVSKDACTWREADFTCMVRFPVGDGTRVECEVMFRALDNHEDIKKLLSLELTGAYVNEVREISKDVIDAVKMRVGRYPSKMQGGVTWSGIWCDTNPWNTQHWGHTLFKRNLPDHKMWRQPSGRSTEAENRENLPKDYYERLIAGADAEWVKVYVDGEDSSTVVGSIYGDLLGQMGEQREFDHGTDDVFTAWDLGRSDATAIWFFQIEDRNRVRVIDYYEKNLQPLSHYFELCESKGYSYVKHWLPHDAAARTLASEVSVEDQFRRWAPGKVDIGPNLRLMDGLQAARWLLEGRCRFHPRCSQGLDALQAYRREYDPDARAYSSVPVHDWSSHGADAFRYLAVVAKVTGLIQGNRIERVKEAEKAAEKATKPWTYSFTLDDLWAERDAAPKNRRI